MVTDMVKIILDFPDLFDTNEAADQLGIGYATLYRWIKTGKIIPVKGDGRTLIPKSEIIRLQKDRKQAPAATGIIEKDGNP